MGDDAYKDRVRLAAEGAAKKALKEYQPSSRTNKKPEKEVEKACLALMRSLGWSMQIFESKSTYSQKLGRYISQSMKAGTLDCGGSTDDGTAAWVEFKSLGRRSALREGQRQFLIEKIAANNFAVVIDSPEMLTDYYFRWKQIKSENSEKAKEFLMSLIPQKKLSKDFGAE